MEENLIFHLLYLVRYCFFDAFYLLCFISGIPGPVTNINSFSYNCTTILITWDSPTVYLRNDEVSVLYYNLSIIDNINGTLLDTVKVYETNFQFEDKDLFIHRYTYVITGVNELGEGISNNKTFSYQRGIF